VAGEQVDYPARKVVGILGDDPLTSRILGLLLEEAGYEARVLEEASLEDPSASLSGVDLVLCTPLLGGKQKELLSAIKGTPQTAAIPVLRLSTEPKAEQTDSVLPWPWSTEALVGAIEQALLAPGDDPAP
jgi:DNA-binding response OmpR family regulator